MKKKFIKQLCLITVFSTSLNFSATVFAVTNESNLQKQAKEIVSNVDKNDLGLSTQDLNTIKLNISKLLCSKYEMMKTGKLQSYKDIIKDSKLLELVNKTDNYNLKWNKRCNLKAETYSSKVSIENIKKTLNNTYVLNVSFDLDYKLKGSDKLAQSRDEKYRLEVQKEDNKWYINKMVDLNEISEEEAKVYSTNDFKDYDSKINSIINQIDSSEKNIEKDYSNIEKIVLAVKEGEKPGKRVRRSAGYNHSAAVDYAHKYAYNFNPAYHWFDNADCTNFVSQCARHAGIPTSAQWYPTTNSKAWNSVTHFFDYMINAGHAYAPADLCKTAKLGDVVQFFNPSSNSWSHSVILTGIDDRGLTYCAHSVKRKDYNLWDGFRAGKYSAMRVLKFY